MKLFVESEKYYLIATEIMGDDDSTCSNIYGSYAFLLQVMRKGEKAKKCIEIQMNLDAERKLHRTESE